LIFFLKRNLLSDSKSFRHINPAIQGISLEWLSRINAESNWKNLDRIEPHTKKSLGLSVSRLFPADFLIFHWSFFDFYLEFFWSFSFLMISRTKTQKYHKKMITNYRFPLKKSIFSSKNFSIHLKKNSLMIKNLIEFSYPIKSKISLSPSPQNPSLKFLKNFEKPFWMKKIVRKRLYFS